MASLWMMSPTRTDRRHFFLIENSDIGFAEISVALVSAGFRRDAQRKAVFSDQSTHILLSKSSTWAEPSYFGGIIIPNDETIQKARRMGTIVTLFGGLFFLSGIVYVFMLIAAFLAVFAALQTTIMFAGLQTIILILDLAIPPTFLFLLLTGFCGIVTLQYLDFRFTKRNQNLIEHASMSFIPALETIMPDLHIQKLSISTQFGSRRIKAHIPSDVLEKIDHLGLGHVDTRFWDEHSLPLQLLGH
jgi:hypothetical protein